MPQVTATASYSDEIFDKIADTIIRFPGLSYKGIAAKAGIPPSTVKSICAHICNHRKVTRIKEGKGNFFHYYPSNQTDKNQLLLFPSVNLKTSQEKKSASIEIAKMLQEIGTKDAIEAMKEIAIALGGQN